MKYVLAFLLALASSVAIADNNTQDFILKSGQCFGWKGHWKACYDSGTNAVNWKFDGVTKIQFTPSGGILANGVLIDASNGLTATNGEVKLGGTLAADTTVATDGHYFRVGDGTFSDPFATPGAYFFVDPTATGFNNNILASRVEQVDGTNTSNASLTVSGQSAQLYSQTQVSGVLDYSGSIATYNRYGSSAGQDLVYLYGGGPSGSGYISLGVSGVTATWTIDGETKFLDAPQLGDPGSKPSCDATQHGKIWYDAGGAGVADTIEICAKSSLDAYAWRAMATIP